MHDDLDKGYEHDHNGDCAQYRNRGYCSSEDHEQDNPEHCQHAVAMELHSRHSSHVEPRGADTITHTNRTAGSESLIYTTLDEYYGAHVITAPAGRRVSPRAEHTFYIVMAVAVIAITFAGFAKSYYLGSYFHAPALSLTTRVHGAAFTAWVALLLAQSTLVAVRRTDIHRTLGWIGAALGAFMCVIAVKTALMAVHAAVVCCNAELARGFLIVPLADVIVFALFVGGAVLYRRDSGTHKRLMLLATLAILDAATGRWPLRVVQSGAWPYAYLVILDVIILGVVAYDTVVHRRLARAYAYGVPLIIGAHVLREVIRWTAAWRSFASLLVG